MTVRIERVTRAEVNRLISQDERVRLDHSELRIFDKCLLSTAAIWVGVLRGKLVCTWGLVPPTLLSNEAYLWLYATEEVEDCKFLFVRYSQRAVEEMLKTYPTIIGHCEVGEERTMRWVQWLGGTFGKPEFKDKLIPFKIKAKHG